MHWNWNIRPCWFAICGIPFEFSVRGLRISLKIFSTLNAQRQNFTFKTIMDYFYSKTRPLFESIDFLKRRPRQTSTKYLCVYCSTNSHKPSSHSRTSQIKWEIKPYGSTTDEKYTKKIKRRRRRRFNTQKSTARTKPKYYNNGISFIPHEKLRFWTWSRGWWITAKISLWIIFCHLPLHKTRTKSV